MKYLFHLAAACLLAMPGIVRAAPDGALIFTSPPRESAEDGEKQYASIAAFLTRTTTTGKTWVYEHPGDWLSYTKNMREDVYDMILDGPHFISWRVQMLEHTPVVRFNGALKFYTVVRNDDPATMLDDLAGHLICGLAPPNMATLAVQAAFDNPMRTPLILEVTDFKSGYQSMLAGDCRGAILPVAVYNRMNTEGKVDAAAKIVFESKPIPQQGFSVSRRIPTEMQEQIRAALLTPEGHAATEAARKRYGGGKDLTATDREEYLGYAFFLRDYWGFEVVEPTVAEGAPAPETGSGEGAGDAGAVDAAASGASTAAKP